ncbi:MAG TPA: hypothetical protein VHU83_17730 [Bryobacteraceae bacterium]|nr:hypothetical protein [Bryobacteraceae bacterium]
MLSQVQGLNSKTNWENLVGNYGTCLNYFTWYVQNYGSRRDPREPLFRLAMYRRSDSKSQAAQNASTAAAVGGTIVGGGTGSVVADGEIYGDPN